MAGWETLRGLVREELRQRREEGYDLTGMEAAFAALEHAGDAALNALYDAILHRPKRPDFPYVEPNGLEEIRRESSGWDIAPRTLGDAELLDKLHGAWVGRAAGCALGKPVETGCYMEGTEDAEGWRNVKAWFQGADAYPIRGYTPEHSRAEAQGLDLARYCVRSMREHIAYMESDDDIRYSVLGLLMMERHGAAWDSWDVGRLWHEKLSYGQVCTAETQAYLNFAQVKSHMHGEKPEDFREKLDWVRTYRNPYREWIGAQIRVDAYGYCAAGDPALAARLAWEDASFSHVKNGIYGAMFCAAMIAAAFTAGDVEEILEAGLAQVPTRSRLYEDIRFAAGLARREKDPEALLQGLWDRFRGMSGVHTNNNAALCAAALLHGAGDYEKAITTAVLGGWDTDCNGATVGSVMGAFLGRGGIPETWAAPLHDTIYADVPGFDPAAMTDCARRCLAVRRTLEKA